MAGVNGGTGSMLGAGLRLPGGAVDTGGTSGGIGIYTDRAVEVPGLFLAPAPLTGRWVVGGAMAATSAAVEWFREVAGSGWTTDELVAAAAAVPAGANRLVFLPYLAGERAPVFNERARGRSSGSPWVTGALTSPVPCSKQPRSPCGSCWARQVRRCAEFRLAGRPSHDMGGLGVPMGDPRDRGGGGWRGEPGSAGGRAAPGPRDRGRRRGPSSTGGSSPIPPSAPWTPGSGLYRSLYPALAPLMHALGGVAGPLVRTPRAGGGTFRTEPSGQGAIPDRW